MKQVIFDKKDAKKASTVFNKKMSNYFSIGIDARIVLEKDLKDIEQQIDFVI